MKIPRNLSATASASIGLVFLFLNPAFGAESIYPDAITPAARGNDAPNWELGTIFRPDLAGKITHVRVFSLADESGDHQVRIWRNADSTLIAGPIPWSFGGDESWITLDIPDVSIEGNQDYTISISTVAGWYPANGEYFSAAGDNGQHLHYPVGAGVFSETAGDRPTASFSNSAYLRDIVFEPDLNGPGIEVRGGNGKIADGAATVSFEDGNQFGGAKAGSGTVERTFTIANPGASNLQLTGNPKIVISGPQAAEFTVISQPTSPVPAGGSATFTVRFQPAATGLRDASVVITNSVAPGNPYDFPIEGIGIGSGNLIIGNPSDGNTTSAIDDHFIAGIRGLALRAMRITSIRAKVAELAGKFKCAVYSDNHGQPDHLLQGTAEVSNPTNGWQTFALA